MKLNSIQTKLFRLFSHVCEYTLKGVDPPPLSIVQLFIDIFKQPILPV